MKQTREARIFGVLQDRTRCHGTRASTTRNPTVRGGACQSAFAAFSEVPDLRAMRRGLCRTSQRGCGHAAVCVLVAVRAVAWASPWAVGSSHGPHATQKPSSASRFWVEKGGRKHRGDICFLNSWIVWTWAKKIDCAGKVGFYF